MQGCFHCMKIFEETEITRHRKDLLYEEREGRPKPVCPCCGVDSVVQFQDALKILHQFYFHEYKL